MKALDLTGKVFGRLTAVARVQGASRPKWLCKCSCGNTHEVTVSNLTRTFKSTKSCGCLMDSGVKIVVGNTYDTSSSGPAKVLERCAGDYVKIQFKDGTEVEVTQGNLRVGNVRNPNLRVTFGVGYHGQGPYVQHNSKAHEYWSKMLQRAYCPEYKKIHPSYEGVVVCGEWHNFQNFAAWVSEQVGYGDTGYNLDKDRLVKGNKIYGPNFCLLIPQELNKLVADPSTRRGNSPVGTSTRPDLNGQYMARVGKNGSGQGEAYLGLFPTAESAFLAYKKEKEAYIKERTEFWKDKMDSKAYTALMNYTVGITD